MNVIRAFGAVVLLCACAWAQRIELNHGWELLPDRTDNMTVQQAAAAKDWRPVRAGLQWNAQFDDMRDYMGVAWYRVTIEVPQFTTKKNVLLRFGAVDYHTEVFVNGTSVGTHEGGYTPFVFNITAHVKPGKNQVMVRVIDPPMDKGENQRRFPQFIYDEIPHGKQNWYVQTGGIWQPVWLEFRPDAYIDSVKVTTDVTGRFRVTIDVKGRSERPTISVLSPHGDLVFPRSSSVKQFSEPIFHFGGGISFQIESKLSPSLWSPDAPNLYTVEAKYGDDVVTERFGFRSFEARDGKFYLNGKPFYIIGALDQDFYPDTIYTAPSPAYLRDMMLKGKRLGLNLLRCHIKVCQPEYLDAADEVGMLVWYEIPSWNDRNDFTPKAAERGEELYRKMTERDWNHPSVVIQGVINESWGANLKQAEQRKWLLEAFARAKAFTAPLKRLVVDNSPCCDNFHLKTDINDFHQYFSIPDNAHRWDAWVADFASRPAWTFSKHGDAQPTGQEPLVVSEFGNWGLPELPAKLPWWFDRDFAGREVTRPAGVLDRFREFGFDRMWKDFNELARDTQWHQFRSLKHEIEEMRRHGSIQGYVITEFTDINWEVNGLMDMWRNPKAYGDELRRLQQADVVVAKLERRNLHAGEAVRASVSLSHYSDHKLTGAQVKWWTSSGKQGTLAVPSMQSGEVADIGAVEFPAGNADQPRRQDLWLEVRDTQGKLVAQSHQEMFVYPVPQGRKAAIHVQDAALAESLRNAGYTVGGRAGTVLIATRFDSSVQTHVANGGQAIIIANAKDALSAGPLTVVPRAGSDLDGNWVTNFNWARPDSPIFRGLTPRKLLGFEAVATIPEFVIEGVPAANHADVHSGIFYGWLNNNRAFLVQAKHGRGNLILTTFRFHEYGKDPFATALLDRMIAYAASPAIQPENTLPRETTQ